MCQRGDWIVSGNDAKHPKLASAIKFDAGSVLRVPNVIAARIFVGVRSIAGISASSPEGGRASPALFDGYGESQSVPRPSGPLVSTL